MLPTQVGVPRIFAKELSGRIQVTEANMAEVIALVQNGTLTHIFHADTKKYIPIKDEEGGIRLTPGTLVLRELQDGDIVLMNRQPSLHKGSTNAHSVLLHDDDVFKIHPSMAKGYGADYDGFTL
jgi:DNA-directed RNA polymerase subunit A'